MADTQDEVKQLTQQLVETESQYEVEIIEKKLKILDKLKQ